MNRFLGLLLGLAMLASACASGTTAESGRESSGAPEKKKQGDGYGNY